MQLKQKLEEWKVERRLLGFCKWKDFEATLWGRIIEVLKDGFTIEEVDTYGKPDGVSNYLFSETYFFDTDERYAERLTRLADFEPTISTIKYFVKKPERIRKMLVEAVSTGEFCTILLKGEAGAKTVQIVSVDDEWVELRRFSPDLLDSSDLEVWRMSGIKKLQWRTVREEAESFLFNYSKSRG